MKKMGIAIPMILGMGAGAYLYSYSMKHPMKVKSAMNKVKNMMKDGQ